MLLIDIRSTNASAAEFILYRLKLYLLYTWKVSGGCNFGEFFSRQPEGVRRPNFLGT